jgi:hypothetical protein
MSEAPVLLEGYAHLRAEMEGGRPRDEVLAGAGVTIDDWMATQRTWLESMGAELDRGRFELTNRYTKAFLERQRELQALVRKKADPIAIEPAPAPEEQPMLLAKEAPLPTVDELPRFPDPEWPETTRSPDPATETQFLPSLTLKKAPLPFVPPPEEAPPAKAVASGGPGAPPVPWGRTDPTSTGVLDPAMIRAALPFRRDLQESSPQIAPEDDTDLPPPDDGTATLPFGFTAAHLPSAARSVVPPAEGAITTPIPPLRPKGPELPFRPASAQHPGPAPTTPPAPPPALTIEQYASLCAELAASPHQADAIFRRYGLESARERLDVDLGWQERLRRAPDEHRAWQNLYNRYHAYWVEQARPGHGR